VPATDAVFEGALRTFNPMGLNTVRGPLAWMAMVDDVAVPAGAVVVGAGDGFVEVVAVAAGFFDPLHPAPTSIITGITGRRAHRAASTA
jgi:hypothetical protein